MALYREYSEEENDQFVGTAVVSLSVDSGLRWTWSSSEEEAWPHLWSILDVRPGGPADDWMWGVLEREIKDDYKNSGLSNRVSRGTFHSGRRVCQ